MELELKFALSTLEPQLLQKQLARTGVIGRRHPEHKTLRNTYYDTPALALQKNGIALRIRQLGDEANPLWVQTLKTGAAASSALSHRGEWETPLQTNALDPTILRDTPWAEIDPKGHLFAALNPIFTTTFERLSWVVARDGARVEIALDRGNVEMDGLTAPLLELEIELLSGSPEVLFDVASDISQHVALMPLHMSKSERAYRLAQGTLHAPLRAKPPTLTEDMDFGQVTHTVLRECFLQFTANLNTFRDSDAPEVLHQSRVGWRRFKSSLKLFRQLNESSTFPAYTTLKPLLQGLTELRDLDVAATEVFPLHGLDYQQNNVQRILEWDALELLVAQARDEQRQSILSMLAVPAVGQTLLLITRWLETRDFASSSTKRKIPQASKWATKRLAKLADKMEALPKRTKNPAKQHKVRILAKRLRYGIESLRPLLPNKRAERWYRSATRQQANIGLDRDLLQAVLIAQRLGAAKGIVEFLRDPRPVAVSVKV